MDTFGASTLRLGLAKKLNCAPLDFEKYNYYSAAIQHPVRIIKNHQHGTKSNRAIGSRNNVTTPLELPGIARDDEGQIRHDSTVLVPRLHDPPNAACPRDARRILMPRTLTRVG